MFQHLTQVPKGKKVVASEFAAVFGKAASDELSRRGVVSVSESKSVVTIVLKSQQEFPLLGQGKMRLATTASFSYQSGDKLISLKQLKGVTVTRPGAPGWVNLDSIQIVPGAKPGTVSVSSAVSKFLLSLTLHETYSVKDMEDLGWKLPSGFPRS